MPSLDPLPIPESLEDRALREELREILGAPDAHFFKALPTPEIIALAEDLRREAERRRRTSRHRPVWMLLAAGLPLALVFAGMASWGLQQKRRADAMAAAAAQKEQALQRIAAQAQNQGSQLASSRLDKTLVKTPKPGPSPTNPGELVIPVERPSLPPQAETQQVKSR